MVINQHYFQIERPWLVFFRHRTPYRLMEYALPPGFRHVSAAGYFSAAERWVFFDPSTTATGIFVLEGVEADVLLGHWLDQAGGVLRVHSRRRRYYCPVVASCTGAVKALLGIHAPSALLPRQLYRHLVRHGAEVVPIPKETEPWAGYSAAAAAPTGTR
jgi:hypothetical protein